MAKKKQRKTPLYWAPRILAIILIVFLTLLSFDVFIEDYTFFESIAAFLIHMIPAFIVTTLTIIAWKNEKVGGTLFILLGITILALLSRGRFQPFLFLSLPLIIIGALFLGNAYLIKKKNEQKRSKTKAA